MVGIMKCLLVASLAAGAHALPIREKKTLDALNNNIVAEMGELPTVVPLDDKLDAIATIFNNVQSGEHGASYQIDEVQGMSVEELSNEDKASLVLTPTSATQAGVEVTSNSTAEETKEGAYEGDMMPANTSELALFQSLTNAVREQGVSFGAGTAWKGGLVKYCYAGNIRGKTRKVVELAVQQFKKAVPCLTWKDVGLKSDGNGKSTWPPNGKGTAECNESPAIYITSKANDGCWSFVGELPTKTQGFNLGDGCNSIGTAMHE